MACALAFKQTLGALISFHDEEDVRCDRDPLTTYRLPVDADFSTFWCVSRVTEVRNANVEALSTAQFGELSMWCSDADLLLRWCAGVTQACEESTLGQHLRRKNCSDFYTLADSDIVPLADGECLPVLGSDDARFNVKLNKRPGSEFPRFPNQCLAAVRQLRPSVGGSSGGSSGGARTTEAPPEGPGEVFGAALLSGFMGFFFILVTVLLVLNKTIGHRFVAP